MALDYINLNSNICHHRKSCFSILLLLNCILAFVYYLYERNLSDGITIKLTKSNTVRTKLNGKSHPIDQNTPIKYIQTILESEYNYDNLVEFYKTVDKEFSLGLRCTRKAKSIQTTPKVNSTNTTTIKYYSTTISSPSTKTISSTNILGESFSHRYKRNFYTYILNQTNACVNESIDLLIIIISKSDNYKTRDAIRRTWGSGENLGNYSYINIKIFFLIDFDENLNTNIRLENNLFHDIIQVELPPQYTLVTHRVLSIFEWSFRFCRQAKYVFKTDDDIFINLILLLKFVSQLIHKPSNNSFLIADMAIYGYKHYHPGVFRQANDPVGARYVITMDEFPCSHYPDFLSGFGYLVPKNARDALIYASYRNPDRPFRISDVYVTGILPDYLSLARHTMGDYNIRYQGSCEHFFEDPRAFACAAGLHHGDSSDVFAKFNNYWQYVKKTL